MVFQLRHWHEYHWELRAGTQTQAQLSGARPGRRDMLEKGNEGHALIEIINMMSRYFARVRSTPRYALSPGRS